MTFYNVPDLPGIPPMLRDPSALVAPLYQQANSIVVDFAAQAAGTVTNLVDSVTGGALSQLLGPVNDLLGLGGSSQAGPGSSWGLFDSQGQLAIQPDSFLGLEYRNSTRISNYPLEQGAFESYNKVNDPFDVVIGMACGGDETRRAEFLATALAIAQTLDTFTVVTPEQIFESVNVERFDYKRAIHNGVGLITVNFYCKEIRVNTQSEFTNTPASAPTVEEAQAATTPATSDTARAATPLDADQVLNPASASPVSQGQAQAAPSTPAEAAPAPGASSTEFDAPTTAPALTKLPPGYTQAADTGLIRGPDGKVDRQLTLNQGANYIGPGG